MLIHDLRKIALGLKTIINDSKKEKASPFTTHVEVVKRDLVRLFHRNSLAKDVKYLRRMALNLKQLHFDAKQYKAHAVCHFLTTPLGAPFIHTVTFLEAADSFCQQEPKDSDLSGLLTEFGKYGTHFATQLLVNLRDS